MSATSVSTAARSNRDPVLVLASHNLGKLTELRQLIATGLSTHPELDLDVETQIIDAATAGAPDVVEDGVTFAENSLKKAREIAQATGLVAIADDSGLCVDVLNGAPGIFSARWSGTHGDDTANLNLLLAQLSDIPAEHRGAHFRCVASLATPAGQTHVAHGAMQGQLATNATGRGGFGYDPIFIPDGYQCTAAELSPEEKNAISHRGRAFEALLPHILRVLSQS
ncbi:RdgB/HAM1 family non-canonical purine NTP pyrophosphatase [Auritidibacter ignavus]|uniref:RdgB/HAM1 family non-canonical purine NTP pyrophosphatase n=1 Tax=Auritidibacter ignavus TaxID=678932 RepID=UPI00244AB41E|nr:RdgB/HAM1 family non-canonical purine NTP pyrophosphatase [Auritidibacter ignavus]WGH84069.1 RdgB/HAM1 family non-canonical purine NTP pyrophosphatase [Auritidibacter ignavus]